MTAPLATSLNLQLKGVHSSVRLASLIVLGLELEHLKRKLGYAGIGSWQAYRSEAQSGERRTWVEYCKAEAGISERSAQIYHECGEAVKQRLQISQWKDAKWLIGQMEKPPSDLTADERDNMIQCIAPLIHDTSATLLRKEFHAVEACAIPESLPEARAKVKRAEAILKVMKDELREREQKAFQRLCLKALSKTKAEGKLHHFLEP